MRLRIICFEGFRLASLLASSSLLSSSFLSSSSISSLCSSRCYFCCLDADQRLSRCPDRRQRHGKRVCFTLGGRLLHRCVSICV